MWNTLPEKVYFFKPTVHSGIKVPIIIIFLDINLQGKQHRAFIFHFVTCEAPNLLGDMSSGKLQL